MADDPPDSSSADPLPSFIDQDQHPTPASGDPHLISAIGDHIERFIGPIAMVYHEILSGLVHLDVYHVAPTKERPCHFLITSGMSERPMSAPPQARHCRFAELFIALPAAWPMDKASWQRPEWFWPIRELKSHALYPHTKDTWLWYGHTIQTSEGKPYDSSIRFNAVALGPSYLIDTGFSQLQVAPDREIAFFGLFFLFPEELRYKLRRGADALFGRLEKHGITEVMDPSRRNSCRHWWQPRP